MLRFKSRIGFFLCLIVSFVCFQSPPAFAANLVLITAEEARLPVQNGAVQLAARGVTRGPTIEVVAPSAAGRSPIRLQLKFTAHGGARIDSGAVQATYLRMPNVNLTERIRPYLSEGGIDVPAAEVPPGEHVVRVDVTDSDGRKASTSFVLKIEP